MPHLKSLFGRKNSDADAPSRRSSVSAGGLAPDQAAPVISNSSERRGSMAASPVRSSDEFAAPAAAVRSAGSSSPAAPASPHMSYTHRNSSVTSLSSSITRNKSRVHVGTSHGREPQHIRFEMTDNGNHIHYLKNARRQEKLTRMLRDMLAISSRGDDAVSAVHELVGENKQLSLMTGLVSRVKNGEVDLGLVNGASQQQKRNQPNFEGPIGSIKEASAKSLQEKYGKPQEVIGKGSYGVVRVSHKYDAQSGRDVLYAVKEFRKRSAETEESFQERLMSEFCISSSLHHHNIITTLDLMKSSNGGCFEVMEYCSGGDLYSLILSSGNGLPEQEADCFFKQIMRGVVYMHSMGIAHCDLKPENILLTQEGVCKISDFGNGECFRMAWEDSIHMSSGVYGSGPYIAPEEFKNKLFDPRAVDIWAMGIIYMVMRTGSYLWRTAVPDEDEFFEAYLSERKTSSGYEPIEKLSPSKCVYVIYSILDPVPSRRITGKQVLKSEWGRSIRMCPHGDPHHEKHEKQEKLEKENCAQNLPAMPQAPPAALTKQVS